MNMALLRARRCLRLLATLAVGGVLAAAAGAAASAPAMAVLHAPELFPVGTSTNKAPFPVAIAAADVTGNRNSDLVVVNRNTKSVSVLEGDGSGRFVSAETEKVGNRPSGVAIRDLDGDGKLDAAVSNRGSGTVSLLFGKSGGGFEAVQQQVAVGNGPSSVISDDFNADGRPDLAVTNADDGTVEVLLSQGDRSFEPTDQGPRPVGIDPASLAAADFDGNGTLDVVTANSGGSDVSVLFGVGNGELDPAQSIDVGPMPTAVAAKDLNRDGYADVVATVEALNCHCNDSNTLAILLWDPSKHAFSSELQPDDKTSAHPSSVVIVDVDGDGNQDIVAGSGDSAQAAITYGNGKGQFGNTPGLTNGKIALFAAGRAPIALTADQFNGDSQTDLAFADSFLNGVAVVLGDGHGGLREPATTDVESNPVAAAVGDLDGNGTVDATIANSDSGNISILLGNGNGTFTGKPHVQVGSGANDVLLEDFDGDRNLDLAAVSIGGNSVKVCYGRFDAQFDCAAAIRVGNGPHALATGDLNGDKLPDLVTANLGSDDVSVLLNDGPSFSPPTKVKVRFDSQPISVAVADVTGDGQRDMVVADYGTATVSLLRGKGDGTFEPPIHYQVGVHPTAVAAGDLNGDNISDVAVTNRTESSVSVFLASDGQLAPVGDPFGVGVGYKPASVAIEDMNLDGYADLVIANSGGGKMERNVCHARGGPSGGISILAGDGTGTSFVPAGSYASLNDACDVAIGDLNNDNKPDIVVPAARARQGEAYINETR